MSLAKKMYTNEILREKYRVQAEIARKNDHDIKKIAQVMMRD